MLNKRSWAARCAAQDRLAKKGARSQIKSLCKIIYLLLLGCPAMTDTSDSATRLAKSSTFQLRYPSLPHGIAHLIARALQAIAPYPSSQNLSIPLSPSSGQSGHYASPIAHMVAKDWQSTPDAIALQLQTQLLKILEASQLAQTTLQIHREPNHWIRVVCAPALQMACLAQSLATNLADDLHDLNKRLHSEDEPIGLADTDAIFDLQYAHARCHAQLRLAREQTHWEDFSKPLFNLTALSHFNVRSATEQTAEQQLWRSLLDLPLTLVPSRRIVSSRYIFCSEHSAPAPLPLQQIWMNPIDLPWPLSQRTQMRLAQHWRKMFQLVHNHCRILGLSAQRSPQIQHHRIGLMLALTNILEFLLTQVFSVSAPKYL